MGTCLLPFSKNGELGKEDFDKGNARFCDLNIVVSFSTDETNCNKYSITCLGRDCITVKAFFLALACFHRSLRHGSADDIWSLISAALHAKR